jgi:hypothetical protein
MGAPDALGNLWLLGSWGGTMKMQTQHTCTTHGAPIALEGQYQGFMILNADPGTYGAKGLAVAAKKISLRVYIGFQPGETDTSPVYITIAILPDKSLNPHDYYINGGAPMILLPGWNYYEFDIPEKLPGTVALVDEILFEKTNHIDPKFGFIIDNRTVNVGVDNVRLTLP